MDRQHLREKVYAISKRAADLGEISASLRLEEKSATYISVKINPDPLEDNNLLFAATLHLVSKAWSFETDYDKFASLLSQQEIELLNTLDDLGKSQVYNKYIEYMLYRFDTHFQSVQKHIRIHP